MSNTSITYLVGAFAGVFSLAAFAAFILVPAWGSYEKLWEKLVASALSLYVLAAFVGLGVLLGAAFVYFYDQIF